jgi:hypothetical protein
MGWSANFYRWGFDGCLRHVSLENPEKLTEKPRNVILEANSRQFHALTAGH